MADGNYHRTHLPDTSFRSGLHAGKAQMHTLAIQAFKTWLVEQGMDEAELTKHEIRFRELLPLTGK